MARPWDSTVKTARNLGLGALAAALLSVWVLSGNKAAGPTAYYGMVVDPGVEIDKALPKLSELGVHTVRLRMDIKDWATPTVNTGADAYDSALQQAPPLKDQGFQTVLQVNSEGGAMPSYARARAVFEWLLNRPGADKVDVFEIFGPVTVKATDADAFSPTLSVDQQARRYVDGPLKAGWDVFHKARKKVLGAAFTNVQQVANYDSRGSDNLNVTQAYLRAGYLDRVDYGNLQPNLGTPAAQVDWTRVVKALFGPKPVWISEWGLDRSAYPDQADYARAMGAAAPRLREIVDVVCYDSFTPVDGTYGVTDGGLGGYQAQQPAYDTYKGWPK